MRDKWRRFCEEYLLDLNASAAYRRAGYRVSSDESAWRAASRLLGRSEIQQYIRTLMYERTRRTRVTADRVVDELAKIAFANFTDVVEFGSNGVRLRDSAGLDPDVGAAIEEVSQTEIKGAVTFRVRLASKVAALRLLAQHMGLLTDLNVAIATCNRYGLKVVSSDLGQFNELVGSAENLREDSVTSEQFESALEVPPESWGSN